MSRVWSARCSREFLREFPQRATEAPAFMPDSDLHPDPESNRLRLRRSPAPTSRVAPRHWRYDRAFHSTRLWPAAPSAGRSNIACRTGGRASILRGNVGMAAALSVTGFEPAFHHFAKAGAKSDGCAGGRAFNACSLRLCRWPRRPRRLCGEAWGFGFGSSARRRGCPEPPYDRDAAFGVPDYASR